LILVEIIHVNLVQLTLWWMSRWCF